MWGKGGKQWAKKATNRGGIACIVYHYRMVTVRKAEIEDIDALVDLYVYAWTVLYKPYVASDQLPDLDRDYRKNRFAHIINSDACDCLVATYKGEVIGMVYASPTYHCPAKVQPKPETTIWCLYVYAKYMQEGVEAMLFETLLEALKAQGQKRTMVWCIAQDRAAVRFYEKQGGKQDKNIEVPDDFQGTACVVFTWEL